MKRSSFASILLGALALGSAPALASNPQEASSIGTFSAQDAPDDEPGVRTFVCGNYEAEERWVTLLTHPDGDQTFVVKVYDSDHQMVGNWGFGPDTGNSVPVPAGGYVTVNDWQDSDDQGIQGGWVFE